MVHNSSTRAATYADMADLLSRHHIKGALHDSSGGACLVGAIHRAVDSSAERRQYEQEILDEIIARSPMLRTAAAAMALKGKEARYSAPSSDGGMAGIEFWNDAPWRRTRTVVKVLQELAKKHAALAKDELIAELQGAVAELKRDKAALALKVKELEARVAELEAEVGFWKQAWRARRARLSAEQLRTASSELQELDDELNQTLATLMREASATK